MPDWKTYTLTLSAPHGCGNVYVLANRVIGARRADDDVTEVYLDSGDRMFVDEAPEAVMEMRFNALD